MKDMNLVKVFSATMHKDRADLGEKITAWISERPDVSVINTVVTQSSDNEFHCLSITLFCYDAKAR